VSPQQASLYEDSVQDRADLRQIEIQRGRQLVYAAIDQRKRMNRGGEPLHVEVLPACECSRYPFPHIHDDEEKRRFMHRRATWWRSQ
jgi:hypothetical protein